MANNTKHVLIAISLIRLAAQGHRAPCLPLTALPKVKMAGEEPGFMAWASYACAQLTGKLAL